MRWGFCVIYVARSGDPNVYRLMIVTAMTISTAMVVQRLFRSVAVYRAGHVGHENRADVGFFVVFRADFPSHPLKTDPSLKPFSIRFVLSAQSVSLRFASEMLLYAALRLSVESSS